MFVRDLHVGDGGIVGWYRSSSVHGKRIGDLHVNRIGDKIIGGGLFGWY